MGSTTWTPRLTVSWSVSQSVRPFVVLLPMANYQPRSLPIHQLASRRRGPDPAASPVGNYYCREIARFYRSLALVCPSV